MSEFKTADIILAAYLKATGKKLVRIDRLGNRGTFVFDNVLQAVITDYDLGLALIEPKSLSTEIRALTTAARR